MSAKPVRSHVGAVELLMLACRRCGGPMKPGIAMAQTFSGGSPDFIGGPVVTMSAGGPGKLIGCLKCAACGHSMTPNAKAHLLP
jgi:hypothetical protein